MGARYRRERERPVKLVARDDYERGALDVATALVSALAVWDSRRRWIAEAVYVHIEARRREQDIQEGFGEEEVA